VFVDEGTIDEVVGGEDSDAEEDTGESESGEEEDDQSEEESDSEEESEEEDEEDNWIVGTNSALNKKHTKTPLSFLRVWKFIAN